MKIELPEFNPIASERQWVQGEIETSRFIRVFWNAAGQRRYDAGFISLLVRCGWVNTGGNGESTRRWRNHNIADYLQVVYESDQQLARELSRAFPRLSQPAEFLRMHTGITHYYRPLRPATLEFVERHAAQITRTFGHVSSISMKTEARIRGTVEMITGLGFIRTLGREISPLNSLTPTLACLDPSQTFPILNDKTKRLLNVIGEQRDSDGAVALSRLIGLKGIKNSFELDVYAATADFTGIKKDRARKQQPPSRFRDVGLKSEIDSTALIAASSKRIRKIHNALINRLRDCLMWRYTIQEGEFDAVIADWRPGRKLLIEAKTASDGPGGRAQIRQAIGQLFDYRHKFFPNEKVDLAILLPAEPSPDIKALLKSLDIEIMWFKGKKLKGSIEL